MAQQPEMWITQGQPGDQPPGGPPHGSPPPGPGHGWGRWIAIVAGLAVLIGIIAVQHLLNGPTGRGDQQSVEPSTAVSLTPPPTTSRSETPDTAASMTESSGDPGSSETPAYLQTLTRGGGPAMTSTVATPTDPVTTTATPLQPGADWELVGFQWSESVASGDTTVVTYRPSTGAVVSTPVPALNSNGPLSFVVTADAAIIRPIDNVDGYVVPNGQPAHVAGGLLNGGAQVFPSGDPSRAWVDASDGGRFAFEMVDSAGKAMGTSLQSAPALGFQGGMLSRDGDGGVLAAGIGGIYDLSPGGVGLVTHGRVLAAGPTGYLLYECSNAHDCGATLLDRDTGKRTTLAGYQPSPSMIASPVQGVISPDGRYAALLDYASDGPRFLLVDLHTGRSSLAGRSPNSSAVMYGDASSILAFTPDSRTLLIAGAGGVSAVNVATAKASSVPVPPLAAIAIRPAN